MHEEVRRAETLVDLGRPEQAETMLRRYLATHPDDAVATSVLGRALSSGNRPEEAIEVARSAIAGNPQLLQPRITLAEALVKCGRHQAAAEAADRFVEMAPQSYQSHYTRARVRLRIGGRARVDALPDALAAVRLAPDQADTHFLVGQCFTAAAQPWRAAEACRAALAIDPEHHDAQRLLALSELQTGRRRSGMSGLASALRSDPHDAISARTLETVRTARTGRLLLIVYVFAVVETFLSWTAMPLSLRAGFGAIVVVVSGAVVLAGVARVPSGRRRAALVHTWGLIADSSRRPLTYYLFCTVGGLAMAVWPTSTVPTIALVFTVIWWPVTLFLMLSALRHRRITH